MLEHFHTLAKNIVFKAGVPYYIVKPKHSRWSIDVPAGTVRQDGRRAVRCTVNGVGLHVLAHRLAWFMEHGEIPGLLDHKDRDPLHNKTSNLREATPSENAQNRTLASNNTSGKTGVAADRNGFRASIMLNNVRIRKRFKTLEAVVQWRKEQAGLLHPFRPGEKGSVEDMVREALTDERFYE